ncbi:helix-turn-helix domain-containing protein [Paramagnetospirillum kuznetsovii]|uniref:helix-turn-helix domain-containing protein n=1 Tax=Paramagnetospirillum kuznetsovii TaxID=2053833 RepID=UPI002AC32DCC|nr:helix-turn-helix transcriptional regulator [Paramagnetospirillum kuznetsovii]
MGERTRLRRLELGMNQTELGRAVGLTLQQIQKYERGINRVSSSRLFDLSRALHVSVSYFFEGLENSRSAQLDELVSGEVEDPSLRYETRELVRAYYGISDPILRSKVWDLAMALAPSA